MSLVMLAHDTGLGWPEVVFSIATMFFLSVVVAGRWWSKDED